MDIQQAIESRSTICDEDTVMLDKAWAEMIDACATDMPEAIDFIADECTVEDMNMLSEVFDELIYQTQSPELVSAISKAVSRYGEDDKRYSLMPILDESVATYGDYAVRSAYRKARESDSL